MFMLHNIKRLWKYILLESFIIHFLICNFTQLFTGKFWESPISGIFGFIITLFLTFITCASFKFKSPPLANFSILNYNIRK